MGFAISGQQKLPMLPSKKKVFHYKNVYIHDDFRGSADRNDTTSQLLRKAFP